MTQVKILSCLFSYTFSDIPSFSHVAFTPSRNNDLTLLGSMKYVFAELRSLSLTLFVSVTFSHIAAAGHGLAGGIAVLAGGKPVPPILHPKGALSRIILAYTMKPIVVDVHPDKKASEKVWTCRRVRRARIFPFRSVRYGSKSDWTNSWGLKGRGNRAANRPWGETRDLTQ